MHVQLLGRISEAISQGHREGGDGEQSAEESGPGAASASVPAIFGSLCRGDRTRPEKHRHGPSNVQGGDRRDRQRGWRERHYSVRRSPSLRHERQSNVRYALEGLGGVPDSIESVKEE